MKTAAFRKGSGWRGGFTLLEMLVAMLILSTVIASVYSAFHAGVIAAQRAADRKDSVQNILGRLNLMASEIRNAIYWNNAVLIGTQNELYFLTPMRLKDPKDIFPLYRVRYWYEKTGEDTGALHRSVLPWIALQKPGQSHEDLARLEKSQVWLESLHNFQWQYALAKSSGSVLGPSESESEPDADNDASSNVEGNTALAWTKSMDSSANIPYGVRMQWTLPSETDHSRTFSTTFWPALGLYQPKKPPANVAPISAITYSQEPQR